MLSFADAFWVMAVLFVFNYSFDVFDEADRAYAWPVGDGVT